MKRIILFILGYKRLFAEQRYAAEIMNICMRHGYIYRDSAFEDGRIYLTVSLRTAKKLLSSCAKEGIELVEERETGLPRMLYRYRRRYGIAAGAVLSALIIFFSSQVIWDIRVEGNREISDDEVIAELNAAGLSLGRARAKLDTDSIQNRVMISSDKISWISVNIIGTVAEVEIRESEVVEESEDYAAANIVAERDGEIALFEDVRGNILLDIGDRVREGELIVSGLYEGSGKGIRYTRARGKVFARTNREICVEIPLKYEKKVYTGRVFTEKHLIFFEKEIKFYGNSGNSYDSCDTIDTVEYLNVMSMGDLPIGIRTVKHMEYTYESAERSEEEARELANYKLRCQLLPIASEAELLTKNTEINSTDEKLILICEIECIENIAKIKKIDIADLPR